MDSLCSPFSAASAQPLAIFRQRLAVFRHYSAYWRWPKFHTHVLDGSSNIWRKYTWWEEWGGGNLNSVLWLGAFALGLLVSQWQCSGTAPRAVPGRSAMLGRVCLQSPSFLPSFLLLLQGSESHLLEHICWREALWIGQGSLSDSVLLLRVVSCTKQYSGRSVKTGKVRFFFFFSPPLDRLFASICMLFVFVKFSVCDLFAFSLQLICKLTQDVAF